MNDILSTQWDGFVLGLSAGILISLTIAVIVGVVLGIRSIRYWCDENEGRDYLDENTVW